MLAENTFIVRSWKSRIQNGWGERRSKWGRGFIAVDEKAGAKGAPGLTRVPTLLEDIGQDRTGKSVTDNLGYITGVTPLSDVPIRHLMQEGDPDNLPPYITLPPAAASVLAQAEGTRFYSALCQGVLAVNHRVVDQFRRFL